MGLRGVSESWKASRDWAASLIAAAGTERFLYGFSGVSRDRFGAARFLYGFAGVIGGTAIVARFLYGLTGVQGGAVIIVGSAVVAFLLYGFQPKLDHR